MKFEKHVLFFTALALAILRAPHYLTNPRFWAEEGREFFSFAFENSWAETLTLTKFGYYSIFNNGAALLADTLVPLEQAPLVTTLLSLALLMVPIFMITYGHHSLFSTPVLRLMGVAILLFTPPSQEIWLNSIN